MNMFEAMADDLHRQIQEIRKETNAQRLEWQGLKDIVGEAEHDRIVGNPPRTNQGSCHDDERVF
jgi:hypothetical protein